MMERELKESEWQTNRKKERKKEREGQQEIPERQRGRNNGRDKQRYRLLETDKDKLQEIVRKGNRGKRKNTGG